MALSKKCDVGGLGEKTLETWCTHVGITANPVEKDETGWDHLLEFPLLQNETQTSNAPLDLSLQPLKCLVQVKSTDDHRGKCAVKMDNWVRFVNTPLPAFFLVLEFDGTNYCQRAYIVHVDKIYIKKVLKRLREIGNKNQKLLHKKTLQFKYNDKNQLLSLNGKGIETAIKNHVGNSPVSYAEKKINTLQTVGYKNKKFLLKFDILLPDKEINIQEYLVDFAIGLVPHLRVTKGEARDIRFGITAEEPFKLFESGRIEIDQYPDKSEILLSSENNDRHVSVESDVYLPHGINTPEYDFKVRFSTIFFDFILSPFKEEKSTITLTFKPPKGNHKYSLNVLKQMADIILFFDKTGGKRIKIESKNKKICLNTGTINLVTNELFDSFYIKLARSIFAAWTVAKHFNVHNETELLPQELLHQKVQLKSMKNDIKRSGGLVKVKIKSLPDNGKKICVPILSHAVIGQYHVAISSAVLQESIFQITNNEYQMISTDVRLCRQYIWKRGTDPPCTPKKCIQTVIDDYDDLTEVILLKGHHDFMF